MNSQRKTATVHQLLPAANKPDLEVIECLEHLLNEARQGKVIGLAFAALMPGRRYVTHTCGEAKREAQLMRGILLELDDELRDPSRR